MMEAVRTSETSVDNHFTRQYIPEDNSEHIHTCDECSVSSNYVMQHSIMYESLLCWTSQDFPVYAMYAAH
jgi:hypothetical protein